MPSHRRQRFYTSYGRNPSLCSFNNTNTVVPSDKHITYIQCTCTTQYPFRVATFFRQIGPSDSKIHMLMSEVVNKPIVEGFVKKMSTS